MRQGLPQDSVLAPILLVFYIDNLVVILPEETLDTLFVDDVGLQGAGDTIEEAEIKIRKLWTLSQTGVKS